VAALPWLHVRYGIPTVVLTGALAHTAWRRRSRAAAVAVGLVPIVSLAAMAIAFAEWYGSWWPAAQFGDHPPIRSPGRLYQLLAGGLLSADEGWLPFAPVQLLGLAGAGLLVVRLGRPGAIALATAGGYLRSVGISGVAYATVSPPGRFQLLLLPLAAVGVALLLQAHRRAWLAYVPLALLTALLAVAGLRDPAGLHPGAPVLAAMEPWGRLWPDTSHSEGGYDWRASALGPSEPLAPGVYAVALRVTGPGRVTVADDDGRPRSGLGGDGPGPRTTILTVGLRRRGRLHPSIDPGQRLASLQIMPVAGTRPSEALRGFPGLGLAAGWIVALLGVALLSARAPRPGSRRRTGGWRRAPAAAPRRRTPRPARR
jgi:hypothetical protein